VIPPYDPRTTRYDQTYGWSEFTRDFQRGDPDLWYLVLDGAHLCSFCVGQKEVFAATQAGRDRNAEGYDAQWYVIGAEAQSDMTERVECAHCGVPSHNYLATTKAIKGDRR
jgi:hypothetical protein